MRKSNPKNTLSKTLMKEKSDKINTNIGKRLKEARTLDSNNYSQQYVAEYMNTSNTYISNLEKGKGNPSFASIKILADFLNVSLDWLCSDENLETSKDIWLNIPPIHAMLVILNHFEPLIEFGNDYDEPCVKLSFYGSVFPPDKESLIKFFKSYEAIKLLSQNDFDFADEVDILASNLIEKYKHL